MRLCLKILTETFFLSGDVMNERYIKVLKIEPGAHPFVSFLDSTLEALNNAVRHKDGDGKAKTKKIGRGVYILFNSDYCFSGLESNRKVKNEIISGVFYVIGADKNHHPRSLTNDEISKYSSVFWETETFDDEEVIKTSFPYLFSF